METGDLNKFSLCKEFQYYSKDDEIEESIELSNLVCNDQIVPIATEHSSLMTTITMFPNLNLILYVTTWKNSVKRKKELYSKEV